MKAQDLLSRVYLKIATLGFVFFMRTIYKAFVNLLFPPTCLACNQVLVYAERYLCVTCLGTLPNAELDISIKKMMVMKKLYGEVPLSHAFSLYYFSKKGRVQQLLHNLKYAHQTEAIYYLGCYLGHKLLEQGYQFHFDLIVPVPLHAKRLQERGYNQSLIFAEGIGEILQVPLAKNILIKVLATSTQTGRSRRQRWRNVADACRLVEEKGSLVSNQRILLVDDLITTGATIAACAKPLLEASVHSLSMATLAVALQE